MTHVQTGTDGAPLRMSIALLIARHGKWRVALLALAGLLRDDSGPVKTRPIPVPDYLREDIGLPPRDDPLGVSPLMWTMSRP